MADNGNDDWRNEFNQAAANRDPQGNGVNVNGNGRLDGDLEAGATDSSRQSQAGSTPPPNAQQARQGEDGREARARKANLQSGVFGLGGRLFGGVRKSLEASLPLLQEPNAGVVGGQEGVGRAGRQEDVGRAAGGRVGDYGVRQQAQEEGKEDYISQWLQKVQEERAVLRGDKKGGVSPFQALSNEGETNRFRSSRASSSDSLGSSRASSSDSQKMDLSNYALFGFDKSGFSKATVSGQASATGAKGGQSPDTGANRGGQASATGANGGGQSPDTVVVVSSTSASEISSPGGSQGNSPGQ